MWARKGAWFGEHRNRAEYVDNEEKDVTDPDLVKESGVWEQPPQRRGLCLVLNMVRTHIS